LSFFHETGFSEALRPYGVIKSSWQIDDDGFSIDVEIPVRTHCHLVMPDGEEKALHSGKFSFNQKIKH
jgi:hypothetical protein